LKRVPEPFDSRRLQIGKTARGQGRFFIWVKRSLSLLLQRPPLAEADADDEEGEELFATSEH
jgi:hypothetical protein